MLVVEDNDVNQMLVSYQLTQIGVAFDIADNGHEALSFLSENDYTLVICDCHMPYMDGYQLSKQIRSGHSIYKDIPIIAMTADVLNDQRERCLRAGMNDLLSKPIRIDQLRDTLWRWGLFDNNGLDVEQLRGSFGGVDVLVEMLRAANTSLESGLMVPVDADERVDWVHKHTGTVALLGLTSLEKYGAFVETKLQENVELDEYRHYRAKLFLLMRQLGCLIAHMNNEKSDG
nr:response regulator [Salinivibrio sp. IB872]